MALFARATNIFIISNKNNLKFILPITNSTTYKNLPSKFTFSDYSHLNLRFSHSDNRSNNESDSFVTFDNFMTNRRKEAARSILIQVNYEYSCNDLHNYCSKFGNIKSMYYYELPNKLHHILVEFEKSETVDLIFKSVTFTNSDEIIPVQTRLLYFRKSKTKLVNTLKKKMNVKYGKQDPSEKSFLKTLYNAKEPSNQLEKCYNQLKLDDLGLRLRFLTALQIERCFTGIFPDIKVLPFGSTVNGFGKLGCDLDLYVNFNPTLKEKIKESTTSRLVFQSKRLQYNEKNQTADFLRIIGDTLHTFVPGIMNVVKILQARVPIIKFENEMTGIECDLSLSNMTAVYMSELLYLYGEIDRRVRPVVFTIRKWANKSGLTVVYPGKNITNFSLTLLIIFYLQQKKVVPTLLEMKEKALYTDLRITDTNVDCTFLRNISTVRKMSPCVDDSYTLLQGFFNYYSNFDFDIHALCLREGTTVRKKDNSPLYICNPLEPSLNVSRNVTRNELKHISNYFRDASWKLENAPSEPSKSNWGILSLFENNITYKSVNMAYVMNGKYPEDETPNLISIFKR